MASTLFILTVFVSLYILYKIVNDAKTVLFYFGFICVVSVLAFADFFKNTAAMPPRILFAVIPSVLFFIWLYKRLLPKNNNVKLLIAVNTVRVPVEIVLYLLFLKGKVPELMTFSGWNFDIVMGISAIILLIYYKHLNKQILLIWNVLGILFLAFILTIAVLSSPLPIQQLAFNQPNIAVLEFPFILLPTFIVPLVFLSHFLALKLISH